MALAVISRALGCRLAVRLTGVAPRTPAWDRAAIHRELLAAGKADDLGGVTVPRRPGLTYESLNHLALGGPTQQGANRRQHHARLHAEHEAADPQAATGQRVP